MKNKLFLVSLVFLALWQILTAALRDPSNPPTARTGAPGETTCATTGCHGGGAYTGTVSLSGIPDTVTPNTPYVITLTQTSNAVRAGFQLTCLDGNNVKCGTLANGTGTSIASAGGRQYIRQSSAKNLSSGSVSWSFTWTSPASAAGNKATLYFVSLAANGNGNNNGDNALAATKTVVFQSLVAANEPADAPRVAVYPTTVQTSLHVDLADHFSGRLAIFDLHGALMLQQSLKQYNQVDVSQLRKGIYLARVETDGKAVTKKFVVE